MVLRLYEQGKKDGLPSDIIRKDIVQAVDGIVKERRLRGLLPLELKRGYNKKSKYNSAIIAKLQPSTKAIARMAANAVVKVGKGIKEEEITIPVTHEEIEEEDLTKADIQEEEGEAIDISQYDDTTLRNTILPQLQNRIKKLERRPMEFDELYGEFAYKLYQIKQAIIDALRKEDPEELRKDLKTLLNERFKITAGISNGSPNQT